MAQGSTDSRTGCVQNLPPVMMSYLGRGTAFEFWPVVDLAAGQDGYSSCQKEENGIC